MSPAGAPEPIVAFGQVQGCAQVAQLRHGQRDPMHPVVGCIELFQRHTFLEGVDGHVLFPVRGNLVHQGDHGGVECVFDRKHSVRLGRELPLGKGAGLANCRARIIVMRMTKLRFSAALLSVLALLGCTPVAPVPGQVPVEDLEVAPRSDARTAVNNFLTVVDRVEPVAERVCRAETRGTNCNFQIVVDDRVEVPPNAFQTVDDRGRPIVGFTIALIADARNQDELALILGHEAAHHILGHIPRQQESAMTGALLAGVLAAATGASDARVESAQNLGAQLAARRFSKAFELEADRLGTLIAQDAGYDPVNGARYFARVPDPGNMFLGTHPPNRDRVDLIRRTAAGG